MVREVKAVASKKASNRQSTNFNDLEVNHKSIRGLTRAMLIMLDAAAKSNPEVISFVPMREVMHQISMTGDLADKHLDELYQRYEPALKADVYVPERGDA